MVLGETPFTLHSLFETVEGIVALATILLAVATFILAFSTRRMAGETRDLAKSTADEIEVATKTLQEVRRQSEASEAQVAVGHATLGATFRPILINVPPGWEGLAHSGGSVRFSTGERWPLNGDELWRPLFALKDAVAYFVVPVRNTGAGVALIESATIHSASRRRDGNATNAIVPPGELTRLAFTISRDSTTETPLPAMLDQRSFDVEVRYADLGGNSWVTVLTVVQHPPPSESWSVLEVNLGAAGAPPNEWVSSGRMALQ